eukprot:6795316-Pyramimonas_sp.AAC.1
MRAVDEIIEVSRAERLKEIVDDTPIPTDVAEAVAAIVDVSVPLTEAETECFQDGVDVKLPVAVKIDAFKSLTEGDADVTLCNCKLFEETDEFAQTWSTASVLECMSAVSEVTHAVTALKYLHGFLNPGNSMVDISMRLRLDVTRAFNTLKTTIPKIKDMSDLEAKGTTWRTKGSTIMKWVVSAEIAHARLVRNCMKQLVSKLAAGSESVRKLVPQYDRIINEKSFASAL